MITWSLIHYLALRDVKNFTNEEKKQRWTQVGQLRRCNVAAFVQPELWGANTDGNASFWVVKRKLRKLQRAYTVIKDDEMADEILRQ